MIQHLVVQPNDGEIHMLRMPPSARVAVGLEGGVCSGKSTLAGHLRDRAGYERMPEYMEWIEADRLPLPAGTPEERLSYFLDVEAKRAAHAAVMEKVVADRTVITLVAYELAHNRLGLPSAWPDALESAFQGREIIVPSRVIYIGCTDDDRRRRWALRGFDPQSIFVHPAISQAILDLCRVCERLIPVLYVDSSLVDDLQILNDVLRFLSENLPPEVSQNELVEALRLA